MMKLTIKEALQWASSFLKENQMEQADLEAEVMIRTIYQWDRAKFFLHLNQEMDENKREILHHWVERRVQHEPLQHIIGTQEFYGRDFIVNQYVLIPRPETELLIEQVLNYVAPYMDKEALDVVDIGTGSGAIAITLSLERKAWNVHTVDISSDAIETAKQNARNLQANVSFHQGNLLEPLIERRQKVDLIISNPPYIPTKDIMELMDEVKNHEPFLALDGGEDGLDFYRAIVSQSKKVLRPNGVIAFEFGINQEEAIAEMLRNAGASDVTIVPDFQHIPRIILAKMG